MIGPSVHLYLVSSQVRPRCRVTPHPLRGLRIPNLSKGVKRVIGFRRSVVTGEGWFLFVLKD